ncbi:cobyric acid synthase [Methylocella sp.]|uniref:cobyric acid synthase n=1 Tax=Methylocella sp. TaxID=1978226 RepID=UPI003782E3BF
MFQGTGSDVGKSLIVAGLCRAYRRRGLRVAPFKPQNMSNNAAATPDGGEIGRAQALQALACGLPPDVDMNPVLLKPQAGFGAQVVAQGRVLATASARDYQALKPKLLGLTLASFARLRAKVDIVLVEGAGSAAEVNLRRDDIANMGFSQAADVPVVLVGDIDRGGVIAQIVGTRAVLDEADAARIKGFIVNRFRGDPSLFAEGMTLIEARSGWPALGLVPHCPAAAALPAEDSFGLGAASQKSGGKILVAVPLLPGISNFDDLDPLRLEPDLEVGLVRPGEVIPAAARLVLLPGSKTTLADLSAFRAQGWDVDLFAHLRRGGEVLGLCGGYQMLGRVVRDPDGVEGPPGEAAGLGLLDVETELCGDKLLSPVEGESAEDGAPFEGYEMHVGRTFGPGIERPMLILAGGRPDGAVSADGRARGCYAHGLFAAPEQRASLLRRLGGEGAGRSYAQALEDALDAVAAHLEAHLDLDRLLSLATG